MANVANVEATRIVRLELTPELYRVMRFCAADTDKSLAELAREAVEQYLERTGAVEKWKEA